MKKDNTQEMIVYRIVKLFQPIRTEQVKIRAMYQGVSCADRYLRWLQEKGVIEGTKESGNKTKTWRTRKIAGIEILYKGE